jgi:hypothetical protein
LPRYQIKDQKQYNDKSEQLRQEKQEKEKAALDAIAVANEELTKRNLSNQEKELFDLKKQYEEKKKVIEDGGKSAASLTELSEKQRADIELKYKNQRQEQEKINTSILLNLNKCFIQLNHVFDVCRHCLLLLAKTMLGSGQLPEFLVPVRTTGILLSASLVGVNDT